jgi:hypothetical protein
VHSKQNNNNKFDMNQLKGYILCTYIFNCVDTNGYVYISLYIKLHWLLSQEEKWIWYLNTFTHGLILVKWLILESNNLYHFLFSILSMYSCELINLYSFLQWFRNYLYRNLAYIEIMRIIFGMFALYNDVQWESCITLVILIVYRCAVLQSSYTQSG